MTTELTEPAVQTAPDEALDDFTWPFGKQHRRSRRIIGLVLFVAVLIPVVWIGFGPEIHSAWWHLRNGDRFAFANVQFTVPSDRYVRCWGPAQCVLMRDYGLVRWKMGRVGLSWISFTSVTPEGRRVQEELNSKRAKLLQWQLLGETIVPLAGTPMRCQEYLQPNGYYHTIVCFSESSPVMLTFMGSQQNKTDLDALMQTATPRQ